MSGILHIIGGPHQQQQILLKRSIAHLYEDWRREWEAKQPIFVIENVRFVHNPEWQNEMWSITSARAGNHWVWKATRVAFEIGAFTAAGIGMGQALTAIALLPLLHYKMLRLWEKSS